MISSFKRLVTTAVATTAVIAGSVSPLQAQSASEVSMYEAGLNAGERLAAEGYDLYSLETAPYYTAFLKGGQNQTVTVDIPRTGSYILLVGGDNDTVDLDLYFPQVSARDVTFGNTAFINFDVYRPGRFTYNINMLNCQAVNCGVYAVLLSI